MHTHKFVVGLLSAAALAIPTAASATETGGAAVANVSSAAKSSSSADSNTAVRLNKSEVKALQRRLGATVDGKIGDATRIKIKRANVRHGIRKDGRVTAALLQKLGLSVPAAGATYNVASTGGTSGGTASSKAAAAVAAARTKIGLAYGEDGFDCSYLTMWSYKKAGVSIPRTSFDQYKAGTAVDRSAIRAGDLVFFDSNGPGASHVGIAVSSTRVISATSSGGLMEHDIFDRYYWGKHFVGARRVA